MNFDNRPPLTPFPLKASCLALLLAFAAAAWAEEDDEVLRLIRPESSVHLGLGGISRDNQRFGIYNGLHDRGLVGIGEFSIIRRDDATGTWFRTQARNLGLPQAEFRLEHERQGHWQQFFEFDQITRYTPYDVYSRLQGAGSNTLSYPNTSGAQPRATSLLSDLHTERLGAKLGFNHLFKPELEFRVLFQNVEKKGERPFGRGNGTVQEFLVEPIDSTTRQLDAVLNYTGERLQLSGGYYGSWFQNANNQLNVNGGDVALRTATGPGALPFSVIGLAPDNFAHQFHLAGGYQFTPTTRGNFKIAHTNAYQDDSFASVPAPTSGTLPPGGLNMSGRSGLGGRLETTLVNLGLTTRPVKDLFVLGNVRYEDRHDRTPVVRYINVTSAASTTDGYNEPRSLKALNGKLEATYMLPRGVNLSGGVDFEQKERSVAGVRVVGYRDTTDETSYRLELKKSLSEDLNGSIAYIHSDRLGSDYRTLQTWKATTGTFNLSPPYSNRVQPIYIADRVRDKVRLFTDWTPVEALNLQFAFENARDTYGAGRDGLDIGPRQGNARLFSLDATWTLSEKWRTNAWLSRNETSMEQAQGNSVATFWTAALKNSVTALGLGLRGQLTGTIDVGADALLSHDKSVHNLGGAATAQLPDIRYDQTTFKLFGRYALNRDTTVRLDYIRDHRKTDDWTWNGTGSSGAYVYVDGTTLYQNPNETVHFLGLSIRYAFR